jgi:putative ABC transport system permease protein
VAKVSVVRGVAAATGGLVLTDTSFSGTIPSYSGSGRYPGASSGSSSSGSSFSISSFSVDGIQISKSGVGPLTASQVTSGSDFGSTDNKAMIAIVSSSYATQQSLKVGSSIDVAGSTLKVTGIAQVPSGAADVYLPPARHRAWPG